MDGLDKLLTTLAEQGGFLAVAVNLDEPEEDRVLVTLTFGREAEDSDIAGGQAIGYGSSVEEAVAVAAGELAL